MSSTFSSRSAKFLGATQNPANHRLLATSMASSSARAIASDEIFSPERCALLVGAILNGNEREHLLDDDLNELQNLLTTLGIKTVGRVVQKRQKFVAKSFLGEGKLEEIKLMAAAQGAGILVFDHELSGGQARNIESATGLRVKDRTGIILDIFFEHARTPLAKTQVEIARLEYQLPRMTGAWSHFHRQKGGAVNSKGMGEKQIEIDRRRARERIARLQKQLEDMSQDRREQSKGREHELKVAVVGYTNSGKTTIMNSLTRSNFKAKDELFATLDASIRVIDPRTRPKILLSDTVGFIRNLPTSLVESFKSTLDHVLDADLLLHVVDVSYENFREHIATTERVLDEIKAAHIPVILVFNKVDMVDDPFLGRILRQAFPGSIVVSAHREADILKLREHVYDYFATFMEKVYVRMSHSDSESVKTVYQSCLILDTDYTEEGFVHFLVQAPKPTIARLRPFVVEPGSSPFKKKPDHHDSD